MPLDTLAEALSPRLFNPSSFTCLLHFAKSYRLRFLRSLVRRGLRGVKLVISDAHEGLKQAIEKVMAGASWQRCRVHFMRDLLSDVPRGYREEGR